MSRPARRPVIPAALVTVLVAGGAAVLTVDLGAAATTALAGLLASLAVFFHDVEGRRP